MGHGLANSIDFLTAPNSCRAQLYNRVEEIRESEFLILIFGVTGGKGSESELEHWWRY